MARTPTHSNQELIDRVRQLVGSNPRISVAEARKLAGMPCDKQRFDAAFRAVLLEHGWAVLETGEAPHPDFAPFVRIPALDRPLDLFESFVSEVMSGIDADWGRMRATLTAIIERVRLTACESVDAAHRHSLERIARAEARAEEAARYADELERDMHEQAARSRQICHDLELTKTRLEAKVELLEREVARADAFREAAVAGQREAPLTVTRIPEIHARVAARQGERNNGQSASQRDARGAARRRRRNGRRKKSRCR